MKTDLFAIIGTTRLAAGRWLVAENVVVTGQSRAPANPYYSDFKA